MSTAKHLTLFHTDASERSLKIFLHSAFFSPRIVNVGLVFLFVLVDKLNLQSMKIWMRSHEISLMVLSSWLTLDCRAKKTNEMSIYQYSQYGTIQGFELQYQYPDW